MKKMQTATSRKSNRDIPNNPESGVVQTGDNDKATSRSTSTRSSLTPKNPYYVGNFPLNSIIGYTGHFPGIYPEGKYGASHHRLLKRINQPSGRRIRSECGYRAGLDVVGYTGFVPHKQADNIYGETFARSNFSSQKLAKPIQASHRARVNRILDEFHQIAPSNEHGNYHMYRALHK